MVKNNRNSFKLNKCNYSSESYFRERREKKKKIWTNAIQRSILKVLRNKNHFSHKSSLFFFALKLLQAENDNNGLQISSNNAIDSRWNVWILWLSAIDSFLFLVCVLILENYFSLLSVRSVFKIPILSWLNSHSCGLLLILVVSFYFSNHFLCVFVL